MTRNNTKGVHVASSNVTAPVMATVTEPPSSSSSPSESAITMSNLLAATAMNVSASRQPKRRRAGKVDSGTITGTNTSSNVSTTDRMMSSHHNNQPPITTTTQSTKTANPGTVVEIDRLENALINEVSCPTAD